jgi:long-chain fatty acid transport protein
VRNITVIQCLAEARVRPAVTAIVALLIAIVATPSRSSGFLNAIQSVGSAAVSTAGQTALAEDAATLYYNAAGMALLDHSEVLVASGFVAPSSSFSNLGTVDASGQPAAGTTHISDRPFIIPSAFVMLPISDRVRFGIGLFTPFGEAQRYNGDWVGRYFSISSSLTTIEVDPAVAVRVSDSLSLGAGVDIQRAYLKRSNAIDFGSLCFGILGADSCLGLGLLPERADGRLTLDASDWGVGYNLSALYRIGDTTHLGVSFRSSVRHEFVGDARFVVPPAAVPLTEGGVLFQDTTGRGAVTFPAMISFGVSHRLDDHITLLADFDRTFWSSLKALTIDFGNPFQPAEALVFNWHDSNRFAFGAIYSLDEDNDLRGGISYDESPVPSAWRTTDIPDSSAIMISTGLMHRFNQQTSVGISYAFTHFAKASINLSGLGAGTVAGSYQRSSQSLGVQTRIRF